MKKFTTEKFIEKAKKIHGCEFNYTLVDYKKSNIKVDIICEKHGIFKQTPNSHLMGRKCPLCCSINRKETNINKWGFDHPAKTLEIKEKTKQTCLNKYGYDSHNKSSEVKEKKKMTCLKNFNVNYPTQSLEVKKKIKNSNLEKYCVENVFQSEEIKEKIKKSNLEKYGFMYATQNKEIKEKIKNTLLNRYNVGNNTQSHMIDILHLIEDKEWLFKQYIILNKTAIQIADDLGINDTTIGRYLNKHEIEIRYTVGYSIKAIQWLEEIMKEEQIFIQHAGNVGEFKIPGTRYKVDGYCLSNNTVYEFHGDCFHGNPDLYEDEETPNFYKNHLTAKELYNNTKERENKIINLGYNLVVIWENDYNP